jgi:N-acyl-D-aspartate/D-glutamate deacylase
MGPAANERAATSDELERMSTLLRAGLAAGGIGFSTTTSDTHNDGDGNAVPSRFADRHELITLARVCGEFEGTSLELLPRGATELGPFEPDVADLMVAMSVAAQRPLNWNVISPTASNVDSCLAKLAVGDTALANGAKVIGLTMPVDMRARFSLHAGFVLELFNGWSKIMNASTDDKIRAFSDIDRRRAYRESAESTANMRHLTKWADLVLVETFAPSTARFAGLRVGEVAEVLGCDPFDALIEVAIADEMRTTFTRPFREPTQADWDARLRVWEDSRALIGASDAGAHLDMLATFRYSTGFLQEAVREHRLLPIERAIQMLSGAPARLYGLRDRGTIRVGAKADVLVFDEATVGSAPVATRFDLPGGAGRLYADAIGIDHVVCNGVEIAADGSYTSARSGVILRSGRDTCTPTMER